MQSTIDKIDELIAAIRYSAIPADIKWLDPEGVGQMLGFAPRYVLEKLACRPDFPKPMRIGGSGHPRWLASEIHEFAQSQRNKAAK